MAASDKAKLARALRRIERLEAALAEAKAPPRRGRPPLSPRAVERNKEIYFAVQQEIGIEAFGRAHGMKSIRRRRLSIRAACDVLQRTHRYRRHNVDYIRNAYYAFVRYLAENG